MSPDPEDLISALQLLTAMYPLDGELELGPGSAHVLAALEGGESASISTLRGLDLVVRVSVDPEVDSADMAGEEQERLELGISITPKGDKWRTTIAPRQPAFLSRAAFALLVGAITDLYTADTPEDEDDDDDSPSSMILRATEVVRDMLPDLKAQTLSERAPTSTTTSSSASNSNSASTTTNSSGPGPLERVWFWFPSLSTREKRRDLVTYATGYGLTGFVLAGKPALLCVEGGGRDVDRYMADIKSRSWGDIPSYQKKVTERLRIPLDPSGRKFADMRDITALITHHGTYNHRGDMSEVKKLMDSWGVGEDFAGAVMNAS